MIGVMGTAEHGWSRAGMKLLLTELGVDEKIVKLCRPIVCLVANFSSCWYKEWCLMCNHLGLGVLKRSLPLTSFGLPLRCGAIYPREVSASVLYALRPFLEDTLWVG